MTVSGSLGERRFDRPPRDSATGRARRSFGNVVARYLPSILLVAVALLVRSDLAADAFQIYHEVGATKVRIAVPNSAEMIYRPMSS